MDPNVSLAEIKRLTEKWYNQERLDPEDMQSMFELFESLDAWISRGGFLPDAWDLNLRSVKE